MVWQLLLVSLLLAGCSLPSISLPTGGNAGTEDIGAGIHRISLPRGKANCATLDECTLLAAAAEARRAGATHFVLSDPKLHKQIRSLTEGRGADHALECVGAAATIRMAWSSVRRGGSCTIVGVGRKEQEVTFNPLELFHFSRTINSSIYGASDPERDIPVIAEQVLTEQLDLTALITHRISLDEVGVAFERMKSGQGARSVIKLG